MGTLRNILLVLTTAVTGLSCQQEIGFEDTPGSRASAGFLQTDGNGDCLPKTINGTFSVATTLSGDNSLGVEILVTKTGEYRVFTDTLNGYSFSGSGNFSVTGPQTVILKGTGTPIAAGNNIFRVVYGNTSCPVAVNVLAAAASTADFTLPGAGGDCLGAVVNGTYTANTALTALNSVTISVEVTKTGSYAFSTNAANGIMFSASGNFSTAGSQIVTLQGSGTPLVAGSTTLAVSAGAVTCSVVVNVLVSSAFDYYPRSAGSNWTYEIDDNPLDTARFFVDPVQLPIDGNNYSLFRVSRNDNSDSSGYYRKAAADYFRFMDLGDFIGFDTPLWGQYVFLKDNLAAGDNWKSPSFIGEVTIAGLSTQTVTVRFSSTILEKDVAVSISTSTGTELFENVIVVEEKYEQLVMGTWKDITTQVGSFRKFYARGIGMIRYEAFNSAGMVNAIFKLRRYEIY